jgi:ribonuclease HI
MKVVMYTDGACKGNPGPGGWGALLQATTDKGLSERELCGGERETTNNRMEMMAVIEGLLALTRPTEVTIYLDSKYVMQGITEWIVGWKARGWKTAAKQPVKNAVVSTAGHTINWQWVKGHAGNEGNERADGLANKGIPS